MYPNCRHCHKPYPSAPGGVAKPPPWRAGKPDSEGAASKGRELPPDFHLIQAKKQLLKELGPELAKLGLEDTKYKAIMGTLSGEDKLEDAHVSIPMGQDGDKEFNHKLASAKHEAFQQRAQHQAALNKVERAKKELEEAQEQEAESLADLEEAEKYMLILTKVAAHRQAHRVHMLGAKAATSTAPSAGSEDMEEDQETALDQQLNEQANERGNELGNMLDHPPPEGGDDPMEAHKCYNDNINKSLGAFEKARGEAKGRAANKVKGKTKAPTGSHGAGQGPKKPKTNEESPDSGGALSSQGPGGEVQQP